MATNLVSLVMQFLTPDMVGRIASVLGLDRNKVQTAVNAIIPALLAAFGNTAAQPGGAQKLVDAARQQSGTVGAFANMLGTGGQSSFIEKGTQLLSSLLGGRDQNLLAQAVAKFAGVGQGGASSLLGMLAPVVMGSIGQHQGQSLDASQGGSPRQGCPARACGLGDARRAQDGQGCRRHHQHRDHIRSAHRLRPAGSISIANLPQLAVL
jgi:hypothetical protein